MTRDPSFAAWLKAVRQRHKLSQRELSKETGIPYRTIQEYEQGRCMPGTGRHFTLIAMYGTWSDVQKELIS